jgi:hypothetical protein
MNTHSGDLTTNNYYFMTLMTLTNTTTTKKAKPKKENERQEKAKKFRKRFAELPNIRGANSQLKVN